MKKSRLLGAVCACFLCVVSMSSHAALLTRLDGQAVYDTNLDITFIADAIYSSIDLTEEHISQIITTVGSVEGHTLTTDDFITGGIIVPTTWWGAKAWADQLVFGGHDQWRLPKTIQPDNNCTTVTSTGVSYGYDCVGSELGHLYYNEFGGVGGTTLDSIGDQTEIGKFSNFLNAIYWTETDAPIAPDVAWGFGFTPMSFSQDHHDFVSGLQYQFLRDDSGGATAWAVTDGDVFASTVPLPAAAWLFGSGLLGLIVMARRKALQ